MDFKALAANLGFEEDEFLELVDLLLESGGQDLARMQAGHEAGDLEAVGEAAHSLKGAAGNLGFAGLAEIARGIERRARKRQPDGMGAAIAKLQGELNQIANRLTSRRGGA